MNIALIGVGGIGKRHLQCLDVMERAGKARLTAVVDPSTEPVQHTLQELRRRGVRWYPDYRQMLEAEKDLQAVSIVTPIPLHFDMTVHCMERNLYVLLEKPPVPLIQQLNKLITRDEAQRVAVAFQWICSREARRLKQMIIEGELGEIREICIGACWPRRDAYYDRADWAGRMILNGQPVFDGPATNGLAHVIHGAMYFCGETLKGFGRPKTIEAELYRARPIEGYDLICLRGTTATGTTFLASLAHAVEEHRPYRIEVRGSRGSARISMDGARLETDKGPVPFDPADRPDPFVALYEDFSDFAEGRVSRPSSTLSDTTGYVLTTNGALISSNGIHTIGKSWANKYVSHDETGWSVKDITDLINHSFTESSLFSEMDVPWALAGQPLNVDHLTHTPLERFLNEGTCSE